MKTYSKTKATGYKMVVIQDETGMDTIQVRKQTLLSLFASHLRQIAENKIAVKAIA
jgi:hypothetical protein